jgi:acetylglutamate/LysW-gamma-L-alpha-aminoadipate kinase
MLVIKLGGGAGNDPGPLLEELARARPAQARPAQTRPAQTMILVHGGSARVDELSAALGHPPRFLTSPSGYVSRRTDRRTAEIFAMACGDVNRRLVEDLRAGGVHAFGLSGLDGGLLRAKRKTALRAVDESGRVRVVRDDYTGTVESVDAALLELLLGHGLVPVVSPPALSSDGEIVNVDGDRAAAAIAAALGAETLVLLTGAPGLLRDPQDPASRVDRIERQGLDAARQLARGRMRIKLRAVEEALDGGVARVVIAPSATGNPLAKALAGEGTVCS